MYYADPQFGVDITSCTSLYCEHFYSCLISFAVGRRSFPESPRWLATRGHSKRCLDVLQYIAATNGTTLSPGAMATLEKMAGHKEEVYGVASLFSSWRLAKNTALVSITWCVNLYSTYQNYQNSDLYLVL